jgi:signal transduction histidine kinase
LATALNAAVLIPAKEKLQLNHIIVIVIVMIIVIIIIIIIIAHILESGAHDSREGDGTRRSIASHAFNVRGTIDAQEARQLPQTMTRLTSTQPRHLVKRFPGRVIECRAQPSVFPKACAAASVGLIGN